MPEVIGNEDEQDKQRSSPSMISSASVLPIVRSRAPAHDGQMRYASRLFFKHSHYNNGHKKHKRHKKHKMNPGFYICDFCAFLWLVTFAAVVSRNHAEAVLILGGLEEIAD